MAALKEQAAAFNAAHGSPEQSPTLLPEQRAGADGEAFNEDAAVHLSTEVGAVPVTSYITWGVGAPADFSPLPLLSEAASPASRGSCGSNAVVRALLLPDERAEQTTSRQRCGYDLADVTAGLEQGGAGQVSCPGHLHPA